MDHKADVGFVNAHAKGVGGHHHPGLVVDEALLALAALLVLHPGVIPGGGDALGQQGGGDGIHRFPRGAVDDAALPRPLRQEAGEPLVLVPGPDHLEKEIGPVKARGDPQGVPELQQGFDVPAHRRRGGGGEGPHRGPDREGTDQLRDFQIAGPEILAPLGDAVGLVHGNQGDGQLLQQAAEALRLEAFRGNIEELALPPADLAVDRPVFLRVQGGVDVRGGDARLGQGGYLVLHQGDEGGDHQRHPRQQQGGELVADGFARPGGHDAHRVPAREQGVYQGLLPGAEAAVAEILFQKGELVHGTGLLCSYFWAVIR